MIGPTDLLHPSSAPHFKTFHALVSPPYHGEGVWLRQWPWELYQR